MVFIRKLKKWWRIEWRESDPSDEDYCPKSYWFGGDFPYIHKYPQEELDRRLQADYEATMKFITEYIDRIEEERKNKENKENKESKENKENKESNTIRNE